MLDTTIEIVKKSIKDGKSKEESQQEKVLKDYESWGVFLEFLNTSYWIDAIYRSYKE